MATQTKNYIFKSKNTLLIKVPYTDLDATNSINFVETTVRAIESYSPDVVIVDFSQTSFVDGEGLAAIINLWRIANIREANMIICCLNDNIRTTMQLKKIDNIITIVNSIQQAIDMGRNFTLLKNKHKKDSRNLSSYFGSPFEETSQSTEKEIGRIRNIINHLAEAS